MSREWIMYAEDIAEACGKVMRFTQGLSQKAFVADEKTYDAVVGNLEVIGEAAKHLPDEARARMPEIDWRGAAGFRDMLAHACFGIDEDVLWDVVQSKLPPLQEVVENFLDSQM